MERFVEKMKKKLAKIFPSSNIDLTEISNLILLVAGGIQEFPDDVRNVLALLQQPFHQELLGLFSNDLEAYHLMQQLQGQITITAPVGYTISDETEDLAYAVGLNQNQAIEPAFVWIDYDCQTKIINLKFRWEAPGITIDLTIIDIDTSADLKIYYQWIIQHHQIQNLRTSISGNARYMELLNEAIKQP